MAELKVEVAAAEMGFDAARLKREFRKRKGPVGKSWRMDETYIKAKGK